MTSPDLHLLVAPYALDALDAHERNQFEAHLETCETCRVELDSFVATGVRLGDAESAPPPPELRERILAAARRTSQERPVVTAISQHSRVRRALPRLAVAASFLVAVGGVTGYVVEHDRADDLQVRSDQVSAVMAAEDAAMKTDDVATGGAVRMIASPSHDAGVVVGAGLETLEDDRTYQVWAMRDGEPTSAGLLGRESGMVYVSGIGEADGFAVTVEPKGGSTRPTTGPIASMSI